MEAAATIDGSAELERVWRRLRPRFARAEMRVRCRRYLHGLLSATRRKNGWQLAEVVGERTPHGMQELLNRAVWDADAVRDDLRAYVVEQAIELAQHRLEVGIELRHQGEELGRRVTIDQHGGTLLQ